MTLLRRSLALLCAMATALVAQNPNGAIKGRVIDSAQASVPDATIQATNKATNVVTRSTTNTEGNYELRGLLPGIYRVEVKKEGFKTFVQEPIEVRVADVLSLDLTLELGAITEQVVVRAEAPMLEATNASVSQVVDTRRIVDLPTPGSSVVYQLQTAPTITVTTAPTNLWPPDALGSASGTSVAGTTGTSEFTIDGNPMMTRAGGFTVNPPPEMVQEFRTQVAAFDASLGHFTGAHVNMVMKSGTNDPHGDFVYSNLSRGLMAHDFFTNRFIYDTRTGPITPEKIEAAWPPQRVIRYRGDIGGPLYIPKVYNGKNRTFWMVGGDGVIRQRASRASYTVPTAAERQGDFSALLKLGPQYQIYDPATIQSAANGRFSRQPFPGNIIPANRISAGAKQLLDYWPLPNTPGNTDGTNNYTDPNLADSPYVGYFGRVDHSITENNRLFFSLNRTYADPISDMYFHNIATGTVRNRVQTGISLNDTLILGPSWVAELRYGLNRFSDPTHPPSSGFNLASLGLPSSLVNQLDPDRTTIPAISISNFTGIGGSAGSSPNTTYHTFIAQVTHPMGNHSFRFGADYRILLENVFNYGNVSPAFSFGNTWTVGPLDNSPAAPIGQGLASFLLGIPSGGSIDRNASSAESSRFLGVFFQDDWKITRKLTLNVGLRYEYETSAVERYNRSTRGFDSNVANPVEGQAIANYARSPIAEIPASAFHVRGGLLFAGESGVPRGLTNSDANNFAPRIGLAYQLFGKTVIRTGYGIFYESLGSDRVDAIQSGFSRTTTLVPSLDNGLTFQSTLSNPFPSGILPPIGSALGLRTFLGQNISFVSPDRPNPYVQRWSLDIEHELPHRVLIDVGYLGNRGTKLGVSRDINSVPPQYLSTSLFRDQNVINRLTQAVPNPFTGIADFAGSSLTGANTTVSQLLRPYPEFGSITTITGAGSSWYHALIVRLDKRFSAGLTVQGSYTWSKYMQATEYLNPTDPAPTHVISPNDRTHNLAISGVYEFPFGKGKRWLGSNRFADLLVGGWSINGIYQGASGFPLAFGNVAFYGDINAINIPTSQRTVDRWFNVDAGFERNSARQLANNIRIFPLRLSGARADGYNILNLSVLKNFRIAERLRLQFRAEAVDALNHAIFAAPDLSPTSGTFGQVSTLGAGNTQRRISLGGKVTW